MSASNQVGQSPQPQKPVQLAVVKQITPPVTERLSASIPLYLDKSLPPGLDLHMDKDEVIYWFKLNKTLIHRKLDQNDEEHDEAFPRPIFISPRKPVWILSELIAWQESLKVKRNVGGGK